MRDGIGKTCSATTAVRIVDCVGCDLGHFGHNDGSSPWGSLASTFSLSWASLSSASGSPWHVPITLNVVQVVVGLAVQAHGHHCHHLLIDIQ